MNEELELFLDDDAVFEMYCICIITGFIKAEFLSSSMFGPQHRCVLYDWYIMTLLNTRYARRSVTCDGPLEPQI